MQLPSNERIFNRNSQTWIKWGIILAILGASAYAYRLAERFPLTYLVLGIGVVIAGLFALRDMPLALTGVLLISAPLGLTFGTGSNTPLPMGMLAIAGLTAVWLVKMIVFDKQVHFKDSPLNLPVLAFLFALFVSWIAGELLFSWRLPAPGPGMRVQLGQYAIFLLSFAAMFLAANQALKDRDLQRWTWIIILIGIGEMAYELLTYSYKLRYGGLFGSENSTIPGGITGALYTFPVVMITAQFLFNPSLKKNLRLGSLAALAIFVAWSYQHRVWKGGWAPALIGIAFLLIVKDRRWFLLTLSAAVVVTVTQWDWVYQQFVVTEQHTFSTGRYLFWWDIIRMTSKSPWIGLGLVNYMSYWYDPAFMPLSRLAAGWLTWEQWGFAPPSHNMFVDIYAQSGLIGLALFLWAMAAAIWIMYQTGRRFKAGFTQAYVMGVLCGFIAMLFNSFLFAEWLIPFVYNLTITGFAHSVYTWLLLGSVLGIYFKLKEQPDEPAA